MNRRAQGMVLGSLVVPATLAAATLAATPARAQALDEDIWIEASAYFPGIETALSLSRPGQPGTEIDMESDLGLEDTDTLPAVYVGWRLARKWLITGEYYALNRESSKSIEREIVFDGATYPVGVSVASQIDSNVYRLSLGYAFFQTDRAELGAAVGLHLTDFDLALEGEAQVGPNVRQVVARERNFLAPLPTLGVFGTYEVTDRVVVNGRVDFLSMEVDEYSGGVTNAQASIAYRFNPMFSAGVAYRYVAYDVQADKTDYLADIDYNFSGPSVFARVSF